MRHQEQQVSSLSFLANIPSPTTILHSSYNTIVGAAGNIYSASSWLGGKVFGSFNTLINSEQKFNVEQAQRARTNLPALEVEIAEKVRSAVTILATGTAFYYNPSLALGIFAALRLIPQNAVRAVYQTVFNNDQAAVAQALSTQDLITKGFSLYYGMLPASIIQAMVVGGVEFTLKTFNSNNALPQSYINNRVGERVWLWSGAIASVYQDHRFVTNQQIQRNTIEQLQIQTGNVTRVNSFNCRLTVSGEECSIVQQSIAVQNQQTGDMFYATLNVDAQGIKTPISLATVAVNGVITNHSIDDLSTFAAEINSLINCNSEIITKPTFYISAAKKTADLKQTFRHRPRKIRDGAILSSAAVVVPTKIGSYQTPGSANFITLSQDGLIAFVADGDTGLQIINVSDPAVPVLIGTYDTPGAALSVTLSQDDRIAFIADDDQGLQIIDVFNPAAPIFIGTYYTPDYSKFVALSKDERTVFVADGDSGLQIIDISNPAVPVSIGSYDTPGYARSVILNQDGRIAFIADDSEGLQIIDVSNLTAPIFIGTYYTPGYSESIALSQDERTVFIADGDSGLQIIDISNPAVPVSIGSYDTPGYARSVILSYDGSDAFIGDDTAGLQIIDVSDITVPALISSYVTGGSLYYVTFHQASQITFFADGSAGVSIIRIPALLFSSTPIPVPDALILPGNSPTVVGTATTETATMTPTLPPTATPFMKFNARLNKKIQPVLIRNVGGNPILDVKGADNILCSNDGEFAYVSVNKKIIILDIRDPIKPVSVSTISTADSVTSITILPNHPSLLAIGISVVGGSSGVLLFNISDISQPILVSRTPTTGSAALSIVTLKNHDNLLAVAQGFAGDGVSLIDISNISHPVLVATINTPGWGARFITTLPNHPNLLAVADGFDGVSLLDVGNIFNPVLVTTVSTADSANSILTLPNHLNLLAVADGSAGVSLVDISNISQPTLVSTVHPAYYTKSIINLPNHPNLLAADEGVGVSLIHINNLYNPILITTFSTANHFTSITPLPNHDDLMLATNHDGLIILEINYTPIVQMNRLALKATLSKAGFPFAVINLPNHDNLLATADNDAGVSLIDISNISKPVLVGTVITRSSASSITSIPNYKNLLAVADGFDGVSLLDISNISNPALLAITVKIPGWANSITSLPNHSNLLAVANDAGVSLVDISNIFDPILVATAPTVGMAKSIITLPNHPNFLAASADEGVSLINLGNISNPELVANVSTGSFANSIATLPNRPNLLAVADESVGVLLVDISNISEPVLVATVQTGVSSITTFPNHANLLAIADAGAEVLSLVEISNISRPVFLTRLSIKCDKVYSIAPLPNYSNLLVVTDNDAVLSIIEVNSLVLSASYLPNQKIGQGISEQLLVYSDIPSELLLPNINTVTIQQIATDGINRIDRPFWLNIKRESLTLNGIPPKEEVGQHFAIELNFNGTGVVTGKEDNYKLLFRFDVVSSLNLNKTMVNYTLLNLTTALLPTLAVDAIASLVTMTLTASPSANIKFIITDDFGPVRPSFNPSTGVFEAFGSARALNEMLKKLRYQSLNPSAPATTSISVELTDAGLNYPARDKVDMSYFRENQSPIYANPISDQYIDIRSPLDFTFNPDVFTDADDKSLTYSAYAIDSNTATANRLPHDWLSFVADQRRFSGNFPGIVNQTILVQASDGYYHVNGTFKFIAVVNNKSPEVSRNISSQHAKIGRPFSFFIPRGTFTDPEGQILQYDANISLPWLDFNPLSGTFSGTPADKDEGITTVNLEARDLYQAKNSTAFNVTVDKAPVIKTLIGTQVINAGEAFITAVLNTNFDDDDVLTYSARLANGIDLNSELPWLHFNSTSGEFSGTSPSSLRRTYSIKVTANDGTGGTETITFDMTITPFPTQSGNISNTILGSEKPWRYAVPTTIFNTTEELTYIARLQDGRILPEWLSFANNEFNGIPPKNSGPYEIKLTATDRFGAVVTTGFNLTIKNMPKFIEIAKLTTAMSNQLIENHNYSHTFKKAEFIDLDSLDQDATLNDTQLDVTASDGSALPEWLNFNRSSLTLSGLPVNISQNELLLSITSKYNFSTAQKILLTVAANRAPIISINLDTKTATIGKDFSFNISKGIITDPDGDSLNITTNELPGWLTLQIGGDNDSFHVRFYGTPESKLRCSFEKGLLKCDGGKDDINLFSEKQNTIILRVSDGMVPTERQFVIEVTGTSWLQDTLSWASTIVGILGTTYGFYAYRVQIYNALLWPTYRHFHRKNGEIAENIILRVIKQADSAKYAWQGESAIYRHPILHKLTGALALENQAVAEETQEQRTAREQKILEKTKEIQETIKEIHEIKSFLVMDFPLDTRWQRAKASIWKFIPSAVNKLIIPLNGLTSRIKWLKDIKFGMNKSLFHATKPVEGGLPAWLKREQDTESEFLYTVPIEKNTDVIIGKPIRIRLLKENGICIEEIGMQVVDADVLSANSPIAATNETTGGPAFPIRRLSVLHALKDGDVAGEEMKLLAPGTFGAAMLQDVIEEGPPSILRDIQATAALETREEILAASEVSPLPEMSPQPASGVLAEASADLFPSPSIQQQTANPVSTQDILSAQVQSPLASPARSVSGTTAPILPLFGPIRSNSKPTTGGGGRQATTIAGRKQQRK